MQRGGEAEAAVGADGKIVAAIVLQDDALAAVQTRDVAADAAADGDAAYRHVGHVQPEQRAGAVADGAGLVRGLSEHGDIIGVAAPQRGGEAEAAVGVEA